MDRSQGPILKPPRIPPRPDLPQEEREQLAAEWLIRCHQGATPERIAELAPYTPEFPQGSIYARLADELVRSRVNPSKSQLRRLFRKKDESIGSEPSDESSDSPKRPSSNPLRSRRPP